MVENPFNPIKSITDGKDSEFQSFDKGLTLEDRTKLEEMQKNLNVLSDTSVEYADKMDVICNLQKDILPSLMKELLSVAPNVDRSVVGSRIANVLSDVQKTLTTKRQSLVTDELDPYSKKFQIAFTWFMEIVYMAVKNQGIDDIYINNIFSEVASKLVGWEDQLNKAFKGVSMKALENSSNPFLSEFKGQLKNNKN